MTILAAHPAFLTALAAAAVLMMVRLGLDAKKLAPRRPARRCPSCGVLYDRRYCSRCGRRHGT